jgi:DNA-directed RNA polymerase subunit RPC12/RpoP
MKVNTALLCLDCDELFESLTGTTECPKCSNRSVVAVTSWIKPLVSVFTEVAKADEASK